MRVRTDAEANRSIAPLYMWFVRRRDGSLVSFPGAEQLYHAVIAGQVDAADELSADGRTWAPVFTLPVLAGIIAESGARVGGASDVHSETADRYISGADDEPTNMGPMPQELMQATQPAKAAPQVASVESMLAALERRAAQEALEAVQTQVPTPRAPDYPPPAAAAEATADTQETTIPPEEGDWDAVGEETGSGEWEAERPVPRHEMELSDSFEYRLAVQRRNRLIGAIAGLVLILLILVVVKLASKSSGDDGAAGDVMADVVALAGEADVAREGSAEGGADVTADQAHDAGGGTQASEAGDTAGSNGERDGAATAEVAEETGGIGASDVVDASTQGVMEVESAAEASVADVVAPAEKDSVAAEAAAVGDVVAGGGDGLASVEEVAVQADNTPDSALPEQVPMVAVVSAVVPAEKAPAETTEPSAAKREKRQSKREEQRAEAREVRPSAERKAKEPEADSRSESGPKGDGLKAKADALRKEGKLAEAVKAYEQAAAAGDSRAASHLGAADVLRKLGNCKDALEHYKKAIELSGSRTAYVGAARCYSAVGDTAGARAVLKKGLERHDDKVMRALLDQFGGQ